jgi:hypothetical protein
MSPCTMPCVIRQNRAVELSSSEVRNTGYRNGAGIRPTTGKWPRSRRISAPGEYNYMLVYQGVQSVVHPTHSHVRLPSSLESAPLGTASSISPVFLIVLASRPLRL